ncbi:hypothetical protein FGIG_02957 [Fasciola gigantica]|uniref:Uncharacterized protein n=1 Tax=Fasciola gigantica TaxID=46835 RepID=A0A504YYN1_FASGI|nr:hypothetical protein FGIG_02957 [Fasciola gigantica]
MLFTRGPNKPQNTPLEMGLQKRKTATVENPALDLMEAISVDNTFCSTEPKTTHCYEHQQPSRHARYSRSTSLRLLPATCPVPVNHAEEEEIKHTKDRRHSFSDFLWTKAKRISRRIRRHVLNSVHIFHEDAYGVSWTTAHSLLAHDDELYKHHSLHSTGTFETSKQYSMPHLRTRLYVLDKPAHEQFRPVQYGKFHSLGVHQTSPASYDQTLNHLSLTTLRNIEHELNKRHRHSIQPNALCKRQLARKTSKAANIRDTSSDDSSEHKLGSKRAMESRLSTKEFLMKTDAVNLLQRPGLTRSTCNENLLTEDNAICPNQTCLLNVNRNEVSSSTRARCLSLLHQSLSDDGICRHKYKSAEDAPFRLVSPVPLDSGSIGIVSSAKQHPNVSQLERLLPGMHIRDEKKSVEQHPSYTRETVHKLTTAVSVK